jgi:hypothetical protein
MQTPIHDHLIPKRQIKMPSWTIEHYHTHIYIYLRKKGPKATSLKILYDT